METKEIRKYNKKNVVLEYKDGGFTSGYLEVGNKEIDIYYNSGFGNGAYAYIAHPVKARDIKGIKRE